MELGDRVNVSRLAGRILWGQWRGLRTTLASEEVLERDCANVCEILGDAVADVLVVHTVRACSTAKVEPATGLKHTTTCQYVYITKLVLPPVRP